MIRPIVPKGKLFKITFYKVKVVGKTFIQTIVLKQRGFIVKIRFLFGSPNWCTFVLYYQLHQFLFCTFFGLNLIDDNLAIDSL